MCYTIKWSDRGVIWTYAGVLTGNALIESNLAIYNDPRFETIDYQIVDLRGVEEFRVLSQHMEKVAALDVAASKLNSHIRVAVVSPVVTGRHMTRTYTENTPENHWETQVFDDYAAAYQWATQVVASDQ